MFHGSLVALVTPMQNDGTVDIDKLRQLIEWHIENGTDGIVVLGTTGESVTLTEGEHRLIIEQAREQIKGRIPLIAGTGSNSTAHTIQQTRRAMELGVDACLVVTPYYNKPTQEGLVQHFKAIASTVGIPLILYNVPSRTGCDMLPETVARISDLPNIVGIKEATGNLQRARDLLERCHNNIDLFSGDDATCREFMLLGGKGVISVTANVAPKLMHAMCTAALNNDIETALANDKKLLDLHQKLFVEANPIPVKWALQQMGLISAGIRLPLTPLSAKYHETVRSAMQQASII